MVVGGSELLHVQLRILRVETGGAATADHNVLAHGTACYLVAHRGIPRSKAIEEFDRRSGI